jgi:hypothetical protein
MDCKIGACIDRERALFVIPAEAGIHSRDLGRIAMTQRPRGARIMIVAWNGS